MLSIEILFDSNDSNIFFARQTKSKRGNKKPQLRLTNTKKYIKRNCSKNSYPIAMTESSSSDDPKAGTGPASKDCRELSELLREMTTTTTIERLDNDASSATPLATVPLSNSSLIPESSSVGGPCLPHTSAVPTSISRSYNIYGIPTHAFCQVFSDRFVLGVTQLRTKDKTSSSGHIGSWVLCEASRSEIDPKQVDYELSTLLGGATRAGIRDEKEIYARRIAERLLEKKSLPGGTDRIVLLLGISLLQIPTASSFSSIDRFKTLVEVLVELVEEALMIVLG